MVLIRSDTSADVDALSRLLQEVAAAPDVGLIVVLACDANGFTPAALDPLLRACTKPLIGGIFPQILEGTQVYQQGTIVAGLRCRATVTTIERLEQSAPDFEARIGGKLKEFEQGRGTLLVFADGWTTRICALIDALFNTFGLDLDYLGAGAGSLSQRRSPCIMTNDGLLSDAAVLALTDIGAGIGVSHGWTPISQAYKVTEADRNTLISLDWRPAFEVYREIVEAHSGRSFEGAEFFDLAKAYPFGIAKLDNEMIVRDPFIHDGARIVCVGDVPRGTYVNVLHGDTDSLIVAAGRARALAQASYRGVTSEPSLLFIDCVSRVLFLQEAFTREIAAVDTGLPLIGALTLGEIANSGRECLEFYNKTSVVGLLDA